MINKPDVIFYGAGQYAKDNFNELLAKYNPLCFVDIDLNKQNTMLNGIVILSLDKALSLYQNSFIVVTVAAVIVEQVINCLSHKGIDASKIILCSAEKRKGCYYLEQTPWIALSALRIKVVSECFGELCSDRIIGCRGGVARRYC